MNDISAKLQTNGVAREGTRNGRFFRPTVDILELKDRMVIKADMPGTTAERVSVNYDKGVLTLEAPVERRQPENLAYVLQEYQVGGFRREFVINEEIDPSGISAEYKNGVLQVHLPKSENAKPRKIEVKSL